MMDAEGVREIFVCEKDQSKCQVRGMITWRETDLQQDLLIAEVTVLFVSQRLYSFFTH